MRLPTLRFLVPIVACFASPNLSAQSSVSLSATLSAQACGQYTSDCVTSPSGYFTATSGVLAPAAINVTAPSFMGTSASASTSGTVQFGLITWAGSANATDVPNAQIPPNEPNYEPGANASFSGTELDYMVASSATLPVGAPVQILWTVTTTGTIACVGGYVPNEGAYLTVSGQIASGPNSSYSITQYPCKTGVPSISSTITGVVSTTVGQTYTVTHAVSAYLGGNAASAEALGLAWDPPGVTLNIDPITPGVTLTAESGHNYSSMLSSTDAPIPIWALGALGAALFGAASRRLKKAA